MKIIDKKYVATVRWDEDPKSYDERLYKLASQVQDTSVEDVVMVNPIFDDWVLNYADINVDSKKVIVWESTWNNELHWFIKKFPKNWTPQSGWSKRNYDLNTACYFDIIFISYDEPNADENFKRLLEFAPRAKRIQGIKGIHRAHKAAAELAKTDMFYVVDGDSYIVDGWKFDFQPGLFDRDKIYIWKSKNPINDLEYGYGGIKLFPKKLILNANENTIDMTTSLGDVNVISKISNITAFNADPFSTWRSAVRECTKLMSGAIKNGNVDEADNIRIIAWKTIGKDKPYGKFCLEGAAFGLKYGLLNQDDKEALAMINKREWLKLKFTETYPNANI